MKDRCFPSPIGVEFEGLDIDRDGCGERGEAILRDCVEGGHQFSRCRIRLCQVSRDAFELLASTGVRQSAAGHEKRLSASSDRKHEIAIVHARLGTMRRSVSKVGAREWHDRTI